MRTLSYVYGRDRRTTSDGLRYGVLEEEEKFGTVSVELKCGQRERERNVWTVVCGVRCTYVNVSSVQRERLQHTQIIHVLSRHL